MAKSITDGITEISPITDTPTIEDQNVDSNIILETQESDEVRDQSDINTNAEDYSPVEMMSIEERIKNIEILQSL